MTAVKLTGFRELEKALEDLTKSAGKGVLRRGLKKASEPIAKLANSLAPEGLSGDYSKSFVYSTKLNKRQAGLHRKMFKDQKAAVEGFVGTNDPAGVQQEFGNQNHGPQPALRPAWDTESGPTLERLSEILWSELDKAAKRAARKAAKG